MSLGKYSTFSDNPSSLLLFLSDFLTFLILSDLFHCFYRGNAWLIFKINVSLADKSDELNMKKITIAIDGFSSCGKSTMAKDLAREIGYIYIDSGAMYRAVTLYCLRHGLFHGDEVDTDRLKTALPHIDIAFKRVAEAVLVLYLLKIVPPEPFGKKRVLFCNLTPSRRKIEAVYILHLSRQRSLRNIKDSVKMQPLLFGRTLPYANIPPIFPVAKVR
mgnify:CR=1 FL=1